MNYSFEYIDIILLAMIAGFIFLRLRGILGKRTGFEGKASPQFEEILKNINPQAKIHILGIPKKPCVSFYDFINSTDEISISSFFKNINTVIDKLGVREDGYRLITNSGLDGGQEVPHFHIHILAGEKIGSLR